MLHFHRSPALPAEERDLFVLVAPWFLRRNGSRVSVTQHLFVLCHALLANLAKSSGFVAAQRLRFWLKVVHFWGPCILDFLDFQIFQIFRFFFAKPALSEVSHAASKKRSFFGLVAPQFLLQSGFGASVTQRLFVLLHALLASPARSSGSLSAQRLRFWLKVVHFWGSCILDFQIFQIFRFRGLHFSKDLSRSLERRFSGIRAAVPFLVRAALASGQ